MAELIKVDGTTEKLKDISLESLQAAVGGYIELVRSPQSVYEYICDEEGKLKGYPINVIATELARRDKALPIVDFLVGDIVVAEKGELK